MKHKQFPLFHEVFGVSKSDLHTPGPDVVALARASKYLTLEMYGETHNKPATENVFYERLVRYINKASSPSSLHVLVEHATTLCKVTDGVITTIPQFGSDYVWYHANKDIQCIDARLEAGLMSAREVSAMLDFLSQKGDSMDLNKLKKIVQRVGGLLTNDGPYFNIFQEFVQSHQDPYAILFDNTRKLLKQIIASSRPDDGTRHLVYSLVENVHNLGSLFLDMYIMDRVSELIAESEEKKSQVHVVLLTGRNHVIRLAHRLHKVRLFVRDPDGGPLFELEPEQTKNKVYKKYEEAAFAVLG